MELPHPLQMNIQLRKLHLLIQQFIILQKRHTTFITQSLKEIQSGHETGLIDTGPLVHTKLDSDELFVYKKKATYCLSVPLFVHFSSLQ